MTATVSMPVFLRVGDGEELPVGTVEADSAAELQRSVVDLLRAAADAFEEAARGKQEGAD